MIDAFGRKVKRVVYDWRTSEAGGEEFCQAIAGQGGVKDISYNPCRAHGDQHFIDIEYENGLGVRVFNINSITFEAAQDKQCCPEGEK